MKELTRLRGYTDQMVEDANAVIFTFGSYRLGVRSLYTCLAIFTIYRILVLNFFIIFLSILLTLIFLNVYSGSLFFFTNLCYLDHCLAVLSFNQVHGPGADIDTLCVGPSYVNREVHLMTFLIWS